MCFAWQAIRCCPVLFELKPSAATDDVFAGLRYRMLFAVATTELVLLFDTQQLVPFGYLSNLHLAPLTDMAWSADGRVLVGDASVCGASVRVVFRRT